MHASPQEIMVTCPERRAFCIRICRYASPDEGLGATHEVCSILQDALSRDPSLACGKLADKVRPAAARLRRSGGARARHCRALAAAAYRGVLGGRRAP